MALKVNNPGDRRQVLDTLRPDYGHPRLRCICQINFLLGTLPRTLKFFHDMLQVMSCVVIGQRTSIGLKLVKAVGTLKSSQCENLHLDRSSKILLM